MLDFQFAGLPLHVLLVHVMIVGVPLVAILLVVVCAWPAARRVLWLPTLLGALLLLGVMNLTIEAGKWLQARVPEAPLIEAHTAQGEDIIPWMIGLATIAALVGALAIVENRERRGRTDPEVAANRGMSVPPSRRRPGRMAIVALLLIASLGAGAGAVWTIVQIGESGTRAVWEGSFSDQPLSG
ncbi:hypothetical protein ACFQ58_09760 [Agromyces sp. NPDC056523]|uniref:hypothetical protein n=1 Tax=Agromyces sp. NPDC056523 TaxID=3345850 RepID=UPI00366C105E